ncbi:MAG: ATP-binding protein [Lachnospiraceae bacterium]|nr:ATP-binding protein [Lachnospiraceae bacterium]
MKEITLESKRENLKALFDFIIGELNVAGCDDKVIRQCKLCVEEIFLNISNYAYYPHTGDTTVSLDIPEQKDKSRVKIVFSDKGRAFNPLEEKEPDVEADLDSRPIGGLGIFLVLSTMDDVSYKYIDGQNVLTMEKNFFPSAGGLI